MNGIVRAIQRKRFIAEPTRIPLLVPSEGFSDAVPQYQNQ